MRSQFPTYSMYNESYEIISFSSASVSFWDLNPKTHLQVWPWEFCTHYLMFHTHTNTHTHTHTHHIHHIHVVFCLPIMARPPHPQREVPIKRTWITPPVYCYCSRSAAFKNTLANSSETLWHWFGRNECYYRERCRRLKPHLVSKKKEETGQREKERRAQVAAHQGSSGVHSLPLID